MSVHRIVFTLAVVCTVALGAEGRMAVYLGENVSTIERDAAVELSRLWFAASGSVLPIEQTDRLPRRATGFVLGAPGSLPQTERTWPFGYEEPGHDGYVIAPLPGHGTPLLVISAPTPQGVQHGVYGLLSALGFGFYPGGERIPDTLPSLDSLSYLAGSYTPAFRTRGALPWHNYLSGPSAWELADYRAYIDRLVQMRLNLVVFHAYDTDPFAAYEQDGAMVGGGPLPNTSNAGWGSAPLATDQFLAGTGGYFAEEYFGASPSQHTDRDDAIRAAQDLLNRAMAYARERGLATGLGLDVRGDALDPEQQRHVERRIRWVLETYPDLDYLYLWQPEMQGIAPTTDPDPRSPWASYAQRWGEAFADIPEPRRRAEFVRMALYARQARSLIEAIRPDVTLVVAGWGGDDHLRFTDGLPGLDTLMSDDVVFSALDNAAITPSVSRVYGQMTAERRQWPILWLERDGDLWLPQPNLADVAGAVRDARAKGVDGLLAMHWRTETIDHGLGFAARYAWDPTLSTQQFMTDRTRHLVGHAPDDGLIAYMNALERLGYRWIGGEGHDERSPFVWSPGTDRNVSELRRIAFGLRNELSGPDLVSRVTGLVPGVVGDMVTDVVTDVTELAIPSALASRFIPGWTPTTKDLAITELLGDIDVALAFDQAARALAPDEALDALVAGGQTDLAIQYVWDSGLSDAFHAHARRMSSKGDLGVLALMNTKAWADIRDRLKLPEATLRQLEAMPPELLETPALLVLPDRVIVAGVTDDNTRVSVRARPLGARRFTRHELTPVSDGAYALSFPDRVGDEPHFEYGVEVRSGLRTRLVWPPGFPARTQTVSGFTHQPIILTDPALPEGAVSVPAPAIQLQADLDRHSMVVSWEAHLGMEYAVARNGEVLGTVTDGWFEDTAPPSGRTVTYEVTVRNLASGETATATRHVTLPEFPLPDPPAEIFRGARANRAILGWQSDDMRAAAYRVFRYGGDGHVSDSFEITAAPGNYMEVSDRVEGGAPVTYTVASVAPDGRIGAESPPMTIVPSGEALAPRVRLRFDSDEFVVGLAQLAENGLALGGGGWAELPGQEDWELDRELTLSIWVKLDSIDGMPVLICKGAWQEAGYFLQIFNGHVRFYLAGVDTLDAGAVTPGQWQHIAATYGRGQMRIYLDGELAGQKYVAGEPVLGEYGVFLGRYSVSDDAAYFVQGIMDDIQVYNFSLTPEEIRTLYDSARRP